MPGRFACGLLARSVAALPGGASRPCKQTRRLVQASVSPRFLGEELRALFPHLALKNPLARADLDECERRGAARGGSTGPPKDTRPDGEDTMSIRRRSGGFQLVSSWIEEALLADSEEHEDSRVTQRPARDSYTHDRPLLSASIAYRGRSPLLSDLKELCPLLEHDAFESDELETVRPMA